MSSKVYSAAIVGLDSLLVTVEVDHLHAGQHKMIVVGLPDAAVREAKERVSSAVKNSGFRSPHLFGQVTINLAPADLPKMGPLYDMPIAIGFLLSTGQLDVPCEKKMFVGELALDGTIRPVSGILPIALGAAQKGIAELYVPAENALEAAIVTSVTTYGVKNLKELYEHLFGKKQIEAQKHLSFEAVMSVSTTMTDFAYIKGQEHAKRALEIAAAGGHNVLLSGSPGSGKTLLARALPSILPPLTMEESLEVTKIFSVAGRLSSSCALVRDRVFRSPHHSASSASLIGGGIHPRPGEISLAHRGVLFLDEFAEFPKMVLENLRQPLEDGIVTVTRVRGSAVFPARFLLVAAMNPCPCGNYGDSEKPCVCSPLTVIKYQSKISGPIMDRIDLHVTVPRLKIDKLTADTLAESSTTIRNRVIAARKRQEERFFGTPIVTNSDMDVRSMRDHCPLSISCKELLERAVNALHLSARSYGRLIKVARTIADLAGEEHIAPAHIAEAMQYRFHNDK